MSGYLAGTIACAFTAGFIGATAVFRAADGKGWEALTALALFDLAIAVLNALHVLQVSG